jgi:hypothetical protein
MFLKLNSFFVTFQDGQHILITTPSVLLGFRLKVYRAEGTTQWYTAVTTGYNEANNVIRFDRYSKKK